MLKNNNIRIILIGLGNRKGAFSPMFNTDIILSHKLFSGGKRHYELVKDYLPQNHKWITIGNNINEVIETYQNSKDALVVFASGDPYFYGFGNTLKRLIPQATITSFPYFSSLQLLAHKVGLNYGQAKMVSVHGRSWNMLDEVLIKNEQLIGVLTDDEKNPAAIAQRMLTHGFNNYTMIVGEDLETETERISAIDLQKASSTSFNSLNCLFISGLNITKPALGIPEQSFELLEGRPNLITKMPIRLATIQALNLHSANYLWDIGSCTGSVAIEAKRLFPHLKITAFEKRTECNSLITNNIQKFNTPGIELFMGNFPEIVPQGTLNPDRIFIGGHGGKLKHILLYINKLIDIDGTIVINAVQESTKIEFNHVMQELGFRLMPPIKLQVNNGNPIDILTAAKN